MRFILLCVQQVSKESGIQPENMNVCKCASTKDIGFLIQTSLTSALADTVKHILLQDSNLQWCDAMRHNVAICSPNNTCHILWECNLKQHCCWESHISHMSFVCIWYFDSEKLTQKSDYTAPTYVGYEVSKACRFRNVKEGMGSR